VATAGRAPRPRGAERALLVGAGRERRLLERIAATAGTALVLVSDLEAAARWARRLAGLGDVARLDSGVDDAERSRAWKLLGSGALRLGVGTRSALLAPLPAGASLVVIDEHDPAHRPPGAPRIHSRDVALHRAECERLGALFTAATPSVEMWWRAERRQLVLDAAGPGPWPAVTIADTRGILRREPLTPPLARAVREALAAGRRVFLGVSRLTSALACDDCGAVARCASCGIALAYTRAGAVLACRLCGQTSPAGDTCASCAGHRLSPFGWGAERVEHAVRRRFPRARVARYDPESTRGARGEAQRAAAAAADVVIGTRGALRLFGRGALGLAGFVSPDQLLRLPDFRASERAFALVWAAAERVRPDGQVVIQSQNPTHYALEAVARQDLPTFYRHELKFRAELGYPPFRRLAVITARDRTAGDSERLAERVMAALRGVPGATVYPPPPGPGRERARRVVVKGHADLPAQLRSALADFGPSRGRGIIEVEVDPVEWRS
jgi:primosomal protein N' (replication factor Y)